ncbi:MAG: amino acid racemase [Phycisphaeraceae bacterium]|nr:amino acid racemase [Phycisphaeraceae bacterium]
MTKHIGLVGVSPEGAALCMRQISRQAARLLPPHLHPRITLHNEPLAAYIDAIRNNDWHGVGDLLRRSAQVLAQAGAEFCLTPDNAVQYAIHLAEHDSPIPWVGIPDLVAEAVVREGRKVVGLIGTKWVMLGAAYQTQLGLRGIRVLVPEAADVEHLDRIIVGELIYGKVRPESVETALRIIRKLAEMGCEGVILGSSEVPLLVTAENCPLARYDTGDLLAEQAVRFAMSGGESR